MYKLIAVGDITVDIYFKGTQLDEENGRFSLAIGGKYYTDDFYQGLGGSAANVSIHASQLGLDSAVVAKVGENAFKNMIVQNLMKKTVSTEFLYFDSHHISISSILLTQKGEKTVIKYSDPKDHIYVNDTALDRIKMSEIIFMGNLPDVTVTERKEFLKKVRTENNILAINYGSTDTSQGIKYLYQLTKHVDILFVNKYEFSELIGMKAETLDLTKNLHSKVDIEDLTIVVTDGAQGSYVYTKDTVYHQPAEKVQNLVDTTGAGDSYTAAFLVEYAKNKDIQNSMEFASKYVARVIQKLGAN